MKNPLCTVERQTGKKCLVRCCAVRGLTQPTPVLLEETQSYIVFGEQTGKSDGWLEEPVSLSVQLSLETCC